jgi:hypothetical protein
LIFQDRVLAQHDTAGASGTPCTPEVASNQDAKPKLIYSAEE